MLTCPDGVCNNVRVSKILKLLQYIPTEFWKFAIVTNNLGRVIMKEKVREVTKCRNYLEKVLTSMSIMLFLVVFVSVAYAKHQANPINEEYWKYYDLDTEYVTTKTNISLDIMKLMKDRNGIEEPGKASEYHFSIYRNGDIISF